MFIHSHNKYCVSVNGLLQWEKIVVSLFSLGLVIHHGNSFSFVDFIGFLLLILHPASTAHGSSKQDLLSLFLSFPT